MQSYPISESYHRQKTPRHRHRTPVMLMLTKMKKTKTKKKMTRTTKIPRKRVALADDAAEVAAR
jgi:hypothetical protein